MRVETKVGLFVVVGFIMLFGLSTQVGTFKIGGVDGYNLNVEIQDANGLEKNAKVKSRGIEIGKVETFLLKADSVVVTLLIDKNILVPTNSIVSIKQESMLGSKYIDIEFSRDSTFVNPLDTLTKTKHYASFDETSESINEAAKRFDKFMIRLDNLIANNEKNLGELIYNFKLASAEFKETGKIINEKLPNVLDKFANVGSEFETTGKSLNERLPIVMDKFVKLEDTTQNILEENRATLKSAIKNVDTAFEGVNKASNKVESSFNKLDNYLSSTINSRLGVEAKTERMTRDKYNKSYFGIDYSPKPTIHYLVDIASGNDYRDGAANGIHTKGRTLVSAQYGKDFSQIRLRGGIIDSTGGFGADYFTPNKKLKLSLDAFDFNAYNDVRGKNAHLKSYLTYNVKKHIQLYSGYDNFLNRDGKNLFFGLGVKFEDDDLKYILGSGISSVK